jgi:hypothetical protein
MTHRPWLGLIELFVVLSFAAGWGILELVALRMDRRRRLRERASEGNPRHSDGQ